MSGRRRKDIDCTECGTAFVYLADREAVGFGFSVLWMNNDGAEERSVRRCERKLETRLESAVDIVPCPACNQLQPEMVRKYNTRRSRRAYWIGTFVAAIFLALAVNGLGFAYGLSLASLAGGFLVGVAFYFFGNPNRESITPENTGLLRDAFEALVRELESPGGNPRRSTEA